MKQCNYSIINQGTEQIEIEVKVWESPKILKFVPRETWVFAALSMAIHPNVIKVTNVNLVVAPEEKSGYSRK